MFNIVKNGISIIISLISRIHRAMNALSLKIDLPVIVKRFWLFGITIAVSCGNKLKQKLGTANTDK